MIPFSEVRYACLALSRWRWALLAIVSSTFSLMGAVSVAQAGVYLCPGHGNVDNSGAGEVSADINACIASAPDYTTLAIPQGTYRVSTAILITRSNITLTTVGEQGVGQTCEVSVSCATLFADENFFSSPTFGSDGAAEGMVNVSGANVTIDHLIVDGNRSGRLATQGSGALDELSCLQR